MIVFTPDGSFNMFKLCIKYTGRAPVTFTPTQIQTAAMKETHYKNLAQLLVERIGDRHYFNGTVECEWKNASGLLKATLIIYREPLLDPADSTGAATRITDIVPVWWEFETYGEESPVPGDFSWGEFRPYLSGAC